MNPLQMTDDQLLSAISQTAQTIRRLETENPNRWSSTEIAAQNQRSKDRISQRQALTPLLREAVARGLGGLPSDVGVAGMDPDQDVQDLISMAQYSAQTRGFHGDKKILSALEELLATRRAVRRQLLTGEDEKRECKAWCARPVDDRESVSPFIAGLRRGFALRAEDKN